MVASDRMSAFDVVMDEPVPDKGRVLTAMSAFWFEQLRRRGAQPPHLDRRRRRSRPRRATRELAGRMMLVRRCEMLPVECIVRGYLAGSAWKEYRATGTVHGERRAGRPAGGRRPARADVHALDQGRRPATTTRTSAFDDVVALRRRPSVAEQARAAVAGGVRAAAATPRRAGIVVADTKFELGLLDGELVLADEVLTPDSSRFWPADECEPGLDAAGLRQAARAGLARGDGLGQAAATATAPAARSWPPPRPATSRPTSASRADPSPTGPARPPPGWSGQDVVPCHHDGVTFSVLVEVRLRPGIADPQGATIERSLPTLGYRRRRRRHASARPSASRSTRPTRRGARPGRTTCASGS